MNNIDECLTKKKCKRHESFVKAGFYDSETHTYAKNCCDYRCPVHSYEASRGEGSRRASKLTPEHQMVEFVTHFNSCPTQSKIQSYITAKRKFLNNNKLNIKLNAMFHPDDGDWHLHLGFFWTDSRSRDEIIELLYPEMTASKSIMWECRLTPEEDYHSPRFWVWYVWRASDDQYGWVDDCAVPYGYQVPYWSQQPRQRKSPTTTQETPIPACSRNQGVDASDAIKSESLVPGAIANTREIVPVVRDLANSPLVNLAESSNLSVAQLFVEKLGNHRQLCFDFGTHPLFAGFGAAFEGSFLFRTHQTTSGVRSQMFQKQFAIDHLPLKRGISIRSGQIMLFEDRKNIGAVLMAQLNKLATQAGIPTQAVVGPHIDLIDHARLYESLQPHQIRSIHLPSAVNILEPLDFVVRRRDYLEQLIPLRLVVLLLIRNSDVRHDQFFHVFPLAVDTDRRESCGLIRSWFDRPPPIIAGFHAINKDTRQKANGRQQYCIAARYISTNTWEKSHRKPQKPETRENADPPGKRKGSGPPRGV